MDYSITGQILKMNYTGLRGNDIANFIDYQTLADTLITKLKQNFKKSVNFPNNILLMVMESESFVLHHGPYTNLNTIHI